MNLADCRERLGQSASAWAAYVEAAAIAKRQGQADREQFAKENAARLFPTLAKLTIKTVQASPGLSVYRDGLSVDIAAWGEAVPSIPARKSSRRARPGA